MQKVKIAIVDDHKIFRQGVEALFSRSDKTLDVVISAGDGEELLRSMKKNPVDVAIIDIRMPNLNGEEATKIIKKRYPETKIIVLSMYTELTWVRAMLDAGASGYLTKGCGLEEFQAAIETVMKGNVYIDTAVAAENKNFTSVKSKRKRIAFSEFEIELTNLIVNLHSNKQIARKMGFGLKKVEWLKTKLFKKAGVKNSGGLIHFAVSNKLVKS